MVLNVLLYIFGSQCTVKKILFKKEAKSQYITPLQLKHVGFKIFYKNEGLGQGHRQTINWPASEINCMFHNYKILHPVSPATLTITQCLELDEIQLTQTI